MNFRNRDYSPSLGRWLQQDPIGYQAGDTNLYRFVTNASVNHTDPNGEIVPFLIIIGVGVAAVVFPSYANAPGPKDTLYGGTMYDSELYNDPNFQLGMMIITGGRGGRRGQYCPGGRAPEFPGGKITQSGFLSVPERFLGPGYREISPGRYVSADGLRQVRFGLLQGFREQDMTFHESIDNLIRQHRQIYRDCKQTIAHVDDQERDFWRELAGSVVDIMAENREDAKRFLQHPDGKVRSAALGILMSRWKAAADPQFVEACEQMSMTDPDSEVRSLALTHLGSCYQNLGDRRIGKLLAGVVSDTSLPNDVRVAAYSSLFALVGERDSNLELFMDFHFPNDVDWKLVERFREGNLPLFRPDRLSLPAGISEEEHTAFNLYQEGMKALQAGEYPKAITALSEVINRFPHAAGGYLLRGRAYLSQGKFDEAISDLTAAVEINPQFASAFEERSRAYEKKQLIDLAEEDRRRVMALRLSQFR